MIEISTNQRRIARIDHTEKNHKNWSRDGRARAIWMIAKSLNRSTLAQN